MRKPGKQKLARLAKSSVKDVVDLVAAYNALQKVADYRENRIKALQDLDDERCRRIDSLLDTVKAKEKELAELRARFRELEDVVRNDKNTIYNLKARLGYWFTAWRNTTDGREITMTEEIVNRKNG